MATRPAASTLCRTCRRKFITQQSRTISSTSSQSLPPPPSPSQPAPSGRSQYFERIYGPGASQGQQQAQRTPRQQRPSPSPSLPASTNPQPGALTTSLFNEVAAASTTSRIYATQSYHLNLYAHKHNTHLTFTTPSFSPILSFSCGQIGLRKAQRGSFDAAYQLCTFVFRKMQLAQWRIGGKKMTANPLQTIQDIGTQQQNGHGIEVVLRGYGPGREAFQKALLGQEGMMIRAMVNKVTDGTRLKFGGTRSPAVRRLG